MLYWWKMTAMWHEWWHEERWIESRKTCDAQDLKASEEAWLTNHLNIIFCWTMFAINSSAAVHTAYYYFAISTSFGSSSTSSLRQKPTLHHLPLDNHRYLIRVSVQREWRSEIKRKENSTTVLFRPWRSTRSFESFVPISWLILHRLYE